MPLEAVSPSLIAVEEHIKEVNDLIDAIYSDIEHVAGETPEVENDVEHRWRAKDPELPGHDEVLSIKSTDGTTFTIEYFVGADGFDPELAIPVVSGTVHVAGEEQDDFDFTIDLDVLAQVSDFDGSGDILIAVMPLAGGEDELWYDFHDVDLGDGDIENSRTTYWDWNGGESGALEFVADHDDREVTVYSRWDERGGRYDHHTAYFHASLGQIDEIATNCWAPDGSEVFDAWALIDQNHDYYGELDGLEGECVFGPAEDHPSPGEDFNDLPAEGEWKALELSSL